MRNWAEGWYGTAAGLHADSPVLRQIIIDKNPAASQYVRLLLENNDGRVSPARSTPVLPTRKQKDRRRSRTNRRAADCRLTADS
ncbi:unnamed protein product [Colias eurytheme]|nr:unnamed protein product [Colias eurytheme]